MVSYAFHVCNHLECRRDGAQISCDRLPLYEELKADIFYLFLLFVHRLIICHDLPRKLRVLLKESPYRLAYSLLDHVAHLYHLTVERLKLLVKSCPHQPNLPVI